MISCALSRPARSPRPAVDAEARRHLLKLVPSFEAVLLQQYERKHAGGSAEHILHTVASAAASIHFHGNTSFRTALDLALHGPSAELAPQLCQWLKNDIPVPRVSSQQKVFLAGLLTDNEALMPHYTMQLLEYVTARPACTTFVSIYESGSTDRTGTAATCFQPLSWHSPSILASICAAAT